ncbi:hypothetical protein B0T19DRAFT_453877 [Cercophora scortea]|uniref:Ubiquitin-protein ligase sel1 n=1 Tax=Cercophora scortea TaxID=314031 RepID=A0AAE0J591_9PEZI|nr:hypothetical protein B0T19DRAFT_453877 [Cercophora scortea]
MRRHLLWLFLLLQTASISFAEVQPEQHVIGTDSPKETKGDTFRVEVAPAQNGRQTVQPGADLVDSAMVELRKIYHPFHHKSRKQHGIFGSLLHLAMKAVPTLRLSPLPLLEESAQKNNSDAIFILAELNFYGNYSYPKDFRAAFNNYQKLALLDGNSSALYMLGLMYSTGVGGAVERDQARALLYYTFAADQGHTRAEMAVAHRHHAGIGTPKSCETAVKYYKRVADKAIGWYRSGPPGGMGWVPESYRIADDIGGIYGEGASVVSAGANALKAHPSSDAYASIDDIIEYLDLMSQKGDFKASFNLGRIYYEGQRGLPRNLEQAKHYFFKVTQKFWGKKGNNKAVDTTKPGLDKIASKAAGFLGRMYLRGEGVDQSFDRAKFWLDRGRAFGDAQSQHGLGLMFLHGYGVPKNVGNAIEHFRAAADQDFAPAQVQLGALYLDQGNTEDPVAANHVFELAARYGNIEAYYYLAEMNFFGVGREKSCNTGLNYYKNVAERAEPLVSSWAEANLAYEAGDNELAFLEYLSAAEQGYEKAQNNVAFILDPEHSRLPIPQWLYKKAQKPELLENPSLALIYWTRSARQGNIDALVKMGDYYLYGIGTDADVDKAVQCYTGASEYQQSAQALYNLGWMHENGVGLNQDYHLAKRYYDTALETNEEAYLPVALSLLKLRAKSAWNTFTNGRINSIQDEPVSKKDWSLSEWINNFLQADEMYYEDDMDELFDDTMPGGDPGLTDMDDGIFESLAIVGLVGALVFLLMYRQQRQQAARRREEEERRQQQQQQHHGAQGPAARAAAGGNQQPQQQGGDFRGGFMPQPGDPNMGQWAGGVVGH